MNDKDKAREKAIREIDVLISSISDGAEWVSQKRQEMPDYEKEFYKTCDYHAVCEEERCLLPVPERMQDVVDVVVDKVVRGMCDDCIPDEFISLVDNRGRDYVKGKNNRYVGYKGDSMDFTDDCFLAINDDSPERHLFCKCMDVIRGVALELLTRGCEEAAANALNVHMAMRRIFIQKKMKDAYVAKKTEEWDKYWWQIWRLEHSQGGTDTNTDNPKKQQ